MLFSTTSFSDPIQNRKFFLDVDNRIYLANSKPSKLADAVRFVFYNA